MGILRLFALILLIGIQADALVLDISGFAGRDGDVKAVVKSCGDVLALGSLKAQLLASLGQKRDLKNLNLSALSVEPELAKIENYSALNFVDIDGFRMKRPSLYELALLLRATAHNDYYHPVYREMDYNTAFVAAGDTLLVRRSCHRKMCLSMAKVGLSEVFNLASIAQPKDLCADAICAAQRIFGAEQSVYILWLLDKYDLLTSKYADVNADKGGMETNTLKAIILAAQLMPKQFETQTMKQKAFYRFLRGYTRKNKPLAFMNSAGEVYDLTASFNVEFLALAVVHEFGHRVSQVRPDHRLDPEWLQTAGWQETVTGAQTDRLHYEMTFPRESVSRYGDGDGAEDFAETFTLYRLAPQRLKDISRSRYNYMRDHVFNGIEYLDDICQGRVSH